MIPFWFRRRLMPLLPCPCSLWHFTIRSGIVNGKTGKKQLEEIGVVEWGSGGGGDYRVLFEVEGPKVVIYRVRHRKDAYE